MSEKQIRKTDLNAINTNPSIIIGHLNTNNASKIRRSSSIEAVRNRKFPSSIAVSPVRAPAVQRSMSRRKFSSQDSGLLSRGEISLNSSFTDKGILPNLKYSYSCEGKLGGSGELSGKYVKWEAVFEKPIEEFIYPSLELYDDNETPKAQPSVSGRFASPLQHLFSSSSRRGVSGLPTIHTPTTTSSRRTDTERAALLTTQTSSASTKWSVSVSEFHPSESSRRFDETASESSETTMQSQSQQPNKSNLEKRLIIGEEYLRLTMKKKYFEAQAEKEKMNERPTRKQRQASVIVHNVDLPLDVAQGLKTSQTLYGSLLQESEVSASRRLSEIGLPGKNNSDAHSLETKELIQQDRQGISTALTYYRNKAMNSALNGLMKQSLNEVDGHQQPSLRFLSKANKDPDARHNSYQALHSIESRRKAISPPSNETNPFLGMQEEPVDMMDNSTDSDVSEDIDMEAHTEEMSSSLYLSRIRRAMTSTLLGSSVDDVGSPFSENAAVVAEPNDASEDGKSAVRRSSRSRRRRSRKKSAGEDEGSTERDDELNEMKRRFAQDILLIKQLKSGVTPEDFFKKIPHMKSTVKLVLTHYGIGDALGSCLGKSVGSLDMLEKLVLKDNRLTSKSITILLQNLPTQTLRVLDLSYNDMHGSASEWLGEYLKKNIYIETIEISHCKVDSDDANVIFDAMAVAIDNTPIKYDDKGVEIDPNADDFDNDDGKFSIPRRSSTLSGRTNLSSYRHSHSRNSSNNENKFESMSLGPKEIESSQYEELTSGKFEKQMSAKYEKLEGESSIERDDDDSIRTTGYKKPKKKIDISHNKISATGITSLVNYLSKRRCPLTWLDFSWNELGTEGAQILAGAIAENRSLMHVFVNSNSLKDAGCQYIASSLLTNNKIRELAMVQNGLGEKTCFVLSRVLRQHPNLEKLDLSGNPLGDAGARSIFRTMLKDSFSCFVTMRNCTYSSDPKSFNHSNPSSGSPYMLNMSEPYDAARLHALIHMVESGKLLTFEGVHYRETKDGRESPIYLTQKDRKLLLKPSGKKWVPPVTGFLRVQVTYQMRLPTLDMVITDGALQVLLYLVIHAKIETDRKYWLELMCADAHFTTAKVDIMFQALKALSLLGSGGLTKLDILKCVWSNLVDVSNLYDFLCANVPTMEERAALAHEMSFEKYKFNWVNPTGHWRLDLSNRTQRQVMTQLVALNAVESDFSEKHSRRNDTSQKGNWNNFRNEFFKGQDVTVDSNFMQNIPWQGVIEFDYVSTSRPATTDIKTITPYELEILLYHKLGLSSRRKLQKDNMIMYLLGLQIASVRYYFTTADVITIMDCFSNDDITQVKVIVSLFSRIKDIENMDLIMKSLKQNAIQELVHRLGWLNVMNPLKPTHDFQLSQKFMDNRVVTLRILELSAAESGDQLKEQPRTDILLVSLYATMGRLIADGASTKVLRVSYCELGERACPPNWSKRKEFLSSFLVGTHPIFPDVLRTIQMYKELEAAGALTAGPVDTQYAEYKKKEKPSRKTAKKDTSMSLSGSGSIDLQDGGSPTLSTKEYDARDDGA